MKKQIVYLVDNGEEYSDYGILAIFSTKEKAERYIKEQQHTGPYQEWHIEEWELDIPEDGTTWVNQNI